MLSCRLSKRKLRWHDLLMHADLRTLPMITHGEGHGHLRETLWKKKSCNLIVYLQKI